MNSYSLNMALNEFSERFSKSYSLFDKFKIRHQDIREIVSQNNCTDILNNHIVSEYLNDKFYESFENDLIIIKKQIESKNLSQLDLVLKDKRFYYLKDHKNLIRKRISPSSVSRSIASEKGEF